MLKLARLSQQYKDDYVAARNAKFDEVEAEANFDVAATKLPWAQPFIDHLRANRDTLYGGTPSELETQIGIIEAHPDFQKFAAYCNPRPRGKAKNKKMEALCALVERLFNYGKLSKKAGPTGAYGLVKAHRQRICPYCQMHHVNYHMTDKSLKMRPPLDHFYPKSVYPYLAISLYNLIPSCEQCNSRIKLAKNPLLDRLAHPFNDTPALAFATSWKSLTITNRISSPADFSFSFDGVCPESKKMVKFFKLNKRYEWYNFELLDLVNRYNKFMDMAPSLMKSVDRVAYLTGFSEADAAKRAIGLFLLDVAKTIK
ncbi:hypothetical protein [Duganella radicis]|uniref:HNH endonuclease n=1 Tax=Duganella radicis TaxID=551988 RepID=A0A6L6PB90_9BURK|nr:hypothetical protein [Duganella radicis]MTV36210.1 hypothetical protein [Duganella radicis]